METFTCSWCTREGPIENFGWMKPTRRFKVCVRCRENRSESMMERIKEIAPLRNAECLEEEYVNMGAPMKWRCLLCNHEWEASFAAFKVSKSCFQCRTSYRLSIDEAQKIAKEKNAKCLDEVYKNVTTPMNWQCLSCGFQWRSKLIHFRISRGCSNCGTGHKKYTLETIRALAKEKNITCLEERYERSDIPMKWQCNECDHFWSVSLCNFSRTENNCPRCAGKGKYTLEEVQKKAGEKNITCLETEYKHCNTPMRWQCHRCQRKWSTSFRSLVQNIACIKCTFKEKMCLSLQDVYDEIEGRGIICLEEEYQNTHSKMLWECETCHKNWAATFTHIKHSKSGCPHCASYKSEKMTREIFEDILQLPFRKIRPKFLQGLELDGYNPDIQLAFEYDGLQHTKEIPLFHRKEGDFENQKKRDALKDQLCVKNDVYLLRISHEYDFKNEGKLRTHITEQLRGLSLAD